MVEAILFMLILGAACGGLLSVASKVFYVYEDPRIAEVEGTLAGANCGGCGFAGCAAAAAAVVGGKAKPGVCVVAGMETAIAVGAIMGIDAGSAEPLLSVNACDGGKRAEDRFYYSGVDSCQALHAVYGGKRVCSVGCLGLGDCIKSCIFSAINMGPDGYPVVNEQRCVGCGACERACPKSILTVKTMSQRLLHVNLQDDALAPCRQTCPAEIDIPRYIHHIRNGNYAAAVSTIRERNPLLLSCGRVCPHPCEDDCRRGIEDEPVSINQLKRFVADYEMNTGSRIPISCAPETGRKVAVIGGGPAGLSNAFFLRRLGHSVTIFEAMPKLGGIIRYGIPEYRLPKKVLDWEIEGILNLGIEHKTGVKFGVDFTMESLQEEGFEAVFMGIGAWSDYNLGIEGENLKGCYQGINFLSSVAGGNPPPIGKSVAVVGGGNSAIDCVRSLVRLGAEKVYIVYRRTRNEMPANEVEIVAAEHEGIQFQFLAAPVQVIGDADGNVTHIEYLQMELGEPDDSGRRRPVPVEGSETRLEIDMLITAIGQRPDVFFAEKDDKLKDLQITRWNTIDNHPETLQSSLPTVFTGGDSATGASLVVTAIGGGRRAARSIHQFLNEEPVVPAENSLFQKKIPESVFQSVDGVIPKKRTPMPELPVGERIKSMVEVDLVISAEDARYESSRCLSCCRICYNKDPEAKVG